MGTWGGVIEDTSASMEAGTLELSCGSFVTTLKDRRTRKSQKTHSGPPGSLVYRMFQDVSVNDLPFSSIKCDTSGDPVTVQWRAEDMFSGVSRLATGGGMQFDATLDPDDWSVDFTFRTQTGSDKSGDVLLMEGYQIADGGVARSTANLVNDIYAVSAEQDWDYAEAISTVDQPSFQTYGRKQKTVRYYGFASRVALQTRARVDLATWSIPAIPVAFRMSDREPLLQEIRQGDTIRVWSSSANAMYRVNVIGRSVNVDNGSVSISGNAVEL
jgi:hypothetical protein